MASVYLQLNGEHPLWLDGLGRFRGVESRCPEVRFQGYFRTLVIPELSLTIVKGIKGLTANS